MDKGLSFFDQEEDNNEDHSNELLKTFVSESEDQVDRLEELLFDLEKNPHNQDGINAAFRAFHNIKGSSSTINLKTIPDLAHYSESLLQLAREGKYILEESGFGVFLESLSAIKDIIQRLKTDGEEGPKKYFNILAHLEEKILEITQDEKRESNQTLESTDKSEEDDKNKPAQKIEKYVKVNEYQIDRAMQTMGDLLLIRNRFIGLGNFLQKNTEISAIVRDFEIASEELQRRISELRLSSLEPLFNSMRHVARNAALDTGKNVQISFEGGMTQVDRQLMETIRESIIHIIRNAVDHGIETPEERIEKNKDPQGSIKISVFQQSGEILIAIVDDGGGIDSEKIKKIALEKKLITNEEAANFNDQQANQLIFEPGFSTKTEVSKLSGRGVGMDVVKSMVEEVRGRVEVLSKIGFGSTFIMKLPLNLSINDTLFFLVNDTQYSLPLCHVVEVFSSQSPLIINQIETIVDGIKILKLRGEAFPIVELAKLFSYPCSETCGYIMVEHSMKRFVLAVSKILGSSPSFIQPLNKELKIKGPFSGVSKDINGLPVLQIDLMLLAEKIRSAPTHKAQKNKSIAAAIDSDYLLSDLSRMNQKIIVFWADQLYGIPVQKAENITYAMKEEILSIAGGNDFIAIDNETIPIVWPDKILAQKKFSEKTFYWIAIAINEGKKYALPLVNYRGIHEMPMDYKEVDYHTCILGSTKLSEDTLLLIDVNILINTYLNQHKSPISESKEKKKIVLAEDEPFFRSNIVSFLTTHGFEVEVASDGKAALDILEGSAVQPMALVTDIEMPNMDGIHLIRYLRSRDRFRNFPIIVLSAIANNVVTKKAHDAGADLWISKMNHHQVLETLRNINDIRHTNGKWDHKKKEIENEEKIITFYCEGKIFALPMPFVKEVGADKTTSHVPNNETSLKGVTNYHGSIIPCINQLALLNLQDRKQSQSEYDIRLIVDLGDITISLVVDSIGHVIAKNQLQEGEGLFAEQSVDHFHTEIIEKVFCFEDELIFVISRNALRELIKNHYRIAIKHVEIAS